MTSLHRQVRRIYGHCRHVNDLNFMRGKTPLLVDPVGIVMDCHPMMNVEIMAKFP